MKTQPIRATALKIFLPAPTLLALVVGITIGTGSSRRDAAEFAALLLLTLLVLAGWVAITAPGAARFAAQNRFFGIVYGIASLVVSASAFGLASTLAIEDCSFRSCFVPTVCWTIFYCWLVFVICGILFSGASEQMTAAPAREPERNA